MKMKVEEYSDPALIAVLIAYLMLAFMECVIACMGSIPVLEVVGIHVPWLNIVEMINMIIMFHCCCR